MSYIRRDAMVRAMENLERSSVVDDSSDDDSGLPDPSTRPTGERPPFTLPSRPTSKTPSVSQSRCPQLRRRSVDPSDYRIDFTKKDKESPSPQPTPPLIPSHYWNGQNRDSADSSSSFPSTPERASIVSLTSDNQKKKSPAGSKGRRGRPRKTAPSSDSDSEYEEEPRKTRASTAAPASTLKARGRPRRKRVAEPSDNDSDDHYKDELPTSSKSTAKKRRSPLFLRNFNNMRSSTLRRHAELNDTDSEVEEEVLIVEKQRASTVDPQSALNRSRSVRKSAVTKKSQEDHGRSDHRENEDSEYIEPLELRFDHEYGLRLLILDGNTPWMEDRQHNVFGEKKYCDTVHEFSEQVFKFFMQVENVKEDIEKNRLNGSVVLADLHLDAYVLDRKDNQKYPVERIQICRHHTGTQARIRWPVMKLSKKAANAYSRSRDDVEYMAIDEELQEKFEREQDKIKCRQLELELKNYEGVEEKLRRFNEMERKVEEMEEKLQKYDEMEEKLERKRKAKTFYLEKYKQAKQIIGQKTVEATDNEKEMQELRTKWREMTEELKTVTNERNEMRKKQTEMNKLIQDLVESSEKTRNLVESIRQCNEAIATRLVNSSS